MFNGGLNGDGFFNEEYADGAYENGEGCAYGYRAPTPIADLELTLTGITTLKAVQFKWRDVGIIWIPKKCLTSPHNTGIEHWAVTIAQNNIKSLLKDIQFQNRGRITI